MHRIITDLHTIVIIIKTNIMVLVLRLHTALQIKRKAVAGRKGKERQRLENRRQIINELNRKIAQFC